MTMGTRIKKNAKTGKQTVTQYERGIVAPRPTNTGNTYDIKDIVKLIEYAKTQEWI